MRKGDVIVRLKSITLKNIKNVGFGKIQIPTAEYIDKASVLGIYGQNGSGKTAIVDALAFVQQVIFGEKISSNYAELIKSDAEEAVIALEFMVFDQDNIYDVEYVVEFEKNSEFGIVISQEKIYRKTKADVRKINFMTYRRSDKNTVFTPSSHLEELLDGNMDLRMDLIVAKRMAEKENCSYIFGDSSRDLFETVVRKHPENKYYEYARLIILLWHYIVEGLFVISDTHSGMISAKVILPMAFRLEDGTNMKAKGSFAVPMTGPTELTEERYNVLRQILDEINTVLHTIIPGLFIDVQDYGPVLRDDGEQLKRFEIVSIRDGGKPIPIRMESEGIIKIISILNALIHAYCNPSICLVIDELDAGVFEYMLGELLDIFHQGGKGQMIFTSHNLRALEILNVENVVFSTANEKKRYIHMTNIRDTNNFRNAYIRAITLGGQSEKLYSDTDSLKIARAFRKVGRKLRSIDGGKESSTGSGGR